MPESTIESFDLSRDCLALVIQGYGDQIFIGFEKFCATACNKQILQLLEQFSRRLDRPSSTGKAEDLAKDGVDR